MGGRTAVTVTLAPSWLFPEVANAPGTLDEIAEVAARCREAGAAVAHIHAKPGEWTELVPKLRKRTDILIQAGMSSYAIGRRKDAFEARPDMISVMLGQHDEAFPRADVYQIHPREELLGYAKECRKTGVRPEFEVWHQGSIWTLNFLIERGVLAKPYWLTLFFGWPGGNWTPATVEELSHRAGSVPTGSICSVSAMGRNNWGFIAAAISLGLGIRVGTEDCPFDAGGNPAKDCVQLVTRAAQLVKDQGRELATPDDVRNALSLRLSS
jgi:3-keto-5-aminohexanoate cleavage enzyme